MPTRQPSLWAAFLITYIAAFIAFLLRLVARWLKGVRLFYDDYIALVAFLCSTGFTVIHIYKIEVGAGLLNADLDKTFDEIYTDYFRLLWIDSWFYTTGIGLSKVAVLAFYWRIFGRSSIRIPIQIMFVLVVLWMTARIVVMSMECIPIHKFWDLSVDGVCPIKTNYFFFGTTFPHLLMEVVIVVLPLLKIRQLNLPRAQKIAVGGMFMSGIIVIVASIVQLIAAFRLDTKSKDLWWTGAAQLMAAVIEVNLAHFSTSLPNLRPILDLMMGKKIIPAGSNSYPLQTPNSPSHSRSKQARQSSKAYNGDGEYFDMDTGARKVTMSQDELLA